MPVNRLSVAALAVGIGLGLAATSEAVAFPDQPITLVVGFGAGGMTDVSSRIIAEKLEEVTGTTVVVENRPGAGGTLAIANVAEMAADGYTVVSFLTEGPFTATYQERPIDLADWEMIGGYMPQERVLFARSDAPFETVEELVEYAKNEPVTFADGGSFWSSRVMEAYAKKHGLTVRLVPFRSGAEGSAAILGGHVTLAETGVGTSAWQAGRDGGLKILATLTPGGLAPFDLPDVPTFEQLGADYVVRVQYGYAVKAGLPEENLAFLRDAFEQVVEDPEVQAALSEIDLTPVYTDPETYAELMDAVTADADALREYLKEE
jgi:tripartite-type tricarboxylate transporter receptor subunit TctC